MAGRVNAVFDEARDSTPRFSFLEKVTSSASRWTGWRRPWNLPRHSSFCRWTRMPAPSGAISCHSMPLPCRYCRPVHDRHPFQTDGHIALKSPDFAVVAGWMDVKREFVTVIFVPKIHRYDIQPFLVHRRYPANLAFFQNQPQFFRIVHQPCFSSHCHVIRKWVCSNKDMEKCACLWPKWNEGWQL